MVSRVFGIGYGLTLPFAAVLVVQVPAYGPECQNLLKLKGVASIDELASNLNSAYPAAAPCPYNGTAQSLYAPDPMPSIAGAADTTHMACRYGNPQMWGRCGVCCGLRPHFNWILGDCKAREGLGVGQFCRGLPQCLLDGSPKINYIAAYQFDGKEFVLMPESSVGEISADGISGNFGEGTGFEAHKDDFQWIGGDWTTKYAPHRRAGAASGPRGLTPPAAMWVLSAENFYYGAFYMLNQMGINLDAQGQPTGTNCWNWEYDPVEGTAGWSPGKEMPGNVNMLYSSGNAQNSGCMPIPYTSGQMNGLRKKLQFPEEFRSYCEAHPDEQGCTPRIDIHWSGGAGGSQRFENYWDEPYVFAIVVDAKGYWNYRWRPAAYAAGSTTQTGWPGLERYKAASKVPAKPSPVTDPRGLATDVPGDVKEAVMLQPSLNNEESCLRSSIEMMDWQFGSNALASLAGELGLNAPGSTYEGAQNWWTHFVDTKQNAGYPPSIAGIPKSEMKEVLTCRSAGASTCSCEAARRNAALAGHGNATKASNMFV
jgi:hypothetical protein